MQRPLQITGGIVSGVSIKGDIEWMLVGLLTG